jgi:flagellum-specific ATP synthase
MPSVVAEPHLAKAKAVRLLMAAYAHSEDLIRIGAYQKGTDPVLDKAIEILPVLNALLQQTPNVLCSFKDAVDQLMTIPG